MLYIQFPSMTLDENNVLYNNLYSFSLDCWKVDQYNETLNFNNDTPHFHTTSPNLSFFFFYQYTVFPKLLFKTHNGLKSYSIVQFSYTSKFKKAKEKKTFFVTYIESFPVPFDIFIWQHLPWADWYLFHACMEYVIP